MATSHVLILLMVPLLVLGTSSKDQDWSYQVYKDKPYTLNCKTGGFDPSPGEVVTWQRYGREGNLVTNDDYELRPKGGVDNVDLLIHKVTVDTKGISVCHTHNSAQELLDSLVVGLNVGPHKYDDDMDKYGEKIIIGAIAGASVFAFIVVVGLINHFRYLSEDSLEKRRQRKDQRLRLDQNNASYDNDATEMNETR